MSTLPVLDEVSLLPASPASEEATSSTEKQARSRRLPEWLKRPIPSSGGTYFTRNLVSELGLETICESARCPNRSECWTRRTATFMILGETCTRPCGFCAVKRGKPEAVAVDEPRAWPRPVPAAGAAPRRDHLGHSRRPSRRRRRALPPLRPGRPRAHRGDDRGPHSRLRRPPRSDRPRPLGPARGLQPQPRDRRPAPAARPPQEPVRGQPRRSSDTSRRPAPRRGPRAA